MSGWAKLVHPGIPPDRQPLQLWTEDWNLMERALGDESADLGRSLDAFLNEVKGVTDIVIVAGDGLCVAASSQLLPDDIDRMAAILSMLRALAKGAGQYLGGHTVLNIAVQSKSGYLATMNVDE